MTTDTSRRYDLDWLRIIAFGLLILYHIGMFYVTWDWHVKSDRASPAVEPLMLLVNPWRLELLFFISGVATVFLAGKMNSLRFAGSRFNRLFWPLLFGMLVIVPPQSYYEIVSDIQFSAGYLDFYAKYLTAYKGWCDQDGCLSVPTWNHLWYVAYLLVYSLIFAVVWPVLKRLPLGWLGRLPALAYFFIPFAWYWSAKLFLAPVFEDTHALVDDWYLHFLFFGIFLMGAGAARFDRLFEIARASRFLTLGLGLAVWGVLMVLRQMYYAGTLGWPEQIAYPIGTGMEAAQAVLLVFALLGFARQHLANAEGPLRRTLTEAVFPFYIMHQTITVVLAWNLNRLHLPVALEAALLVAGTAAGCWLTYVIVRALPPLRPLFGLRSNPDPQTILEPQRESA